MNTTSLKSAQGQPLWHRLGLRSWATLLVIVGLSILGGGLLLAAERAQRGAIAGQLEGHARGAQAEARNLDELIEGQVLRLDDAAASGIFNLEDSNLEAGKEMLAHFFPRGGFPMYAVLVIDSWGRVLWSEPYLPAVVGSSVASEAYFQEGLQGVAPLVYPKSLVTADGRHVLPIIAPLRSSSGVTTGLLVYLLDLSHGGFARRLHELAPGKTGYVQLVSGDGEVIASTKPQKVGKLIPRWDAILAQVSRTGASIVIEEEEEDQPQRHIIATAPLNQMAGFLVIEQDEDEAFAPLYALRWQIGLFMVLAIIMALIPTYIVMRRVIHVVDGLNAAAARVARGDLATPVPLGGFGELRTLSVSTEEMRQQLERSFGELQQHNRELAALFNIEAAVAGSNTLEGVLPLALAETLRALEADAGAVLLLADGEDLEIVAQQGLSQEFVQALQRIKLGEGVSGQAALQRRPVAMDRSQYPTERYLPLLDDEGVKSLASAPMILDGRVMGAVNVARKTSRPFVSHELEVLGSVANQLAISYRRMELHYALQRRAERRAVLNRITAAITGYLDLSQVFQALAQELEVVLRFDWMAITLLDEASGDLILVDVSQDMPAGPLPRGTRLPLHNSRPGQAILERRTLVVGDLEQEKAYPQDQEILSAGIRSGAFVPLEAKGRILGTLSLGSKEPHRYGPEDLELLEPLACQLALAIENARLYQLTDEKLRRRVADLEALTGVLRAASQGLAMERILADSLRVAVYALGVDRAGVMLLDETGQKATVVAAFGRHGEPHPGLGMSLDVANLPMLTKVLADGEPLVIEDIQSLPGDHQRSLAEAGGVRSVLMVSMLLRGKPIGTLQFTTTSEPKSYIPEELALAQGIADQLAIAIENANLFDQVKEERSTLDAITQSMADGLLVFGTDGEVAYCNRVIADAVGVEAEELLGKPMETFQILLSKAQDPQLLVERWVEAMARKDELPTLDFTFHMGTPRDITATFFPVRTAQGAELGTGVLLRDVTHEREVDRLKSQFVALASHELRTPLTSIYGYAELLLTRQVSEEERRRWLETIYAEAGSLAQIVEDFLNVSRIEAGRLPIEPKPLELRPLLEGILEGLRPQYPHHSFILSLPDDLPKVMADGERLKEVLHNLLGNAAKYSPRSGQIAVAVGLEDSSGHVKISIRDQGVGIAPEDMPRLFGRFVRFVRPETEHVRGTGLGLHIAKALVEAMGGTIWAESQLNVGSTFHFTLPVVGMEEGRGEEPS